MGPHQGPVAYAQIQRPSPMVADHQRDSWPMRNRGPYHLHIIRWVHLGASGPCANSETHREIADAHQRRLLVPVYTSSEACGACTSSNEYAASTSQKAWTGRLTRPDPGLQSEHLVRRIDQMTKQN
jgi:hypothetical protein